MSDLAQRYFDHLLVDKRTGLQLDVSRMRFAPGFLPELETRLQRAYQAMDEIERGAIANSDEKRMVGHYWLRDSKRAPSAEIRTSIDQTLSQIKTFSAKVIDGKIGGEGGEFSHLLVIGIGGSALGPQLVADALSARDSLPLHFFDNTDPDGIDRVLGRLDGKLGHTLTLVVSKSGGTKETRNGMLEAAQAYKRAGLSFAKHAVAVTGDGSELDRHASSEKWLARFPMWDWVGGRTSELSAVGLLPAALQGIDIDGLLAGARAMDETTREKTTRKNPAGLLAAMWLFATSGSGQKDMVILPYKDRLQLMSRYLQQLVMESIGKERDRDGKVVHQGIAVYGNKGSTDQHAYLQQLREGVANFFVTFIEVLRDRQGPSAALESGATCGDYLLGFLLGTRRALYENGRDSVTITLPEVSAFTVGALIALYERAVGIYAELTNINAYHQPGVEAGKKAATSVLDLQTLLIAHLHSHRGQPFTVDKLAADLKQSDDVETLFKILEHACANPDHGITRKPGPSLRETSYLLA